MGVLVQAYTSQIIAITMMALQLAEDSISKREKRDQIIDELGEYMRPQCNWYPLYHSIHSMRSMRSSKLSYSQPLVLCSNHM